MPKINFVKKLALIFLSSILFLNSMIMPFAVAKAADEEPSTWYNQGFTDWYAKVYGDESPPSEIFGERYTAAQVQWIVYSLISVPLSFDQDTQKIVACFFTIMAESGTSIETCGDALVDKFGKFRQFMGANNSKSNDSLVDLMFNENRKLSGVNYLSNKLYNYNIIPEAKAQGFGYTALNPVQKYWSGARDIAYALTVLVVVVFAFMIMFRIKISPQVVISVQSSLPKVFGALILITFSYAIAGFMIDLMYVIGGVFALLIKTGQFSTQDITAIYKDIFPSNQTGMYFLFHMMWYAIFFLIATLINMIAVTVSFGQFLPGTAFSIISILLVVWILILALWYTFKATWVLIKTLISVYINIITAPLQFALGVFVPSMGFGIWFKKIMADLLVFPVTGLFMFFAWRLMWLSYSFGLKAIANENILARIFEFLVDLIGTDANLFDTLWVPEILGFGQTTSGFLVLLMSFGIIAAVPKVPDILKMLFLGGKFDYGSAIGEAMGAFGILPTAQKAGGQFVSDQIYNPRADNDMLRTVQGWWRNRSKGGGPSTTPGAGPVNP